jgi:hypothetical protein
MGNAQTAYLMGFRKWSNRVSFSYSSLIINTYCELWQQREVKFGEERFVEGRGTERRREGVME